MRRTTSQRTAPVQVKGLNNVGFLTDVVAIEAGTEVGAEELHNLRSFSKMLIDLQEEERKRMAVAYFEKNSRQQFTAVTTAEAVW